MAEKLVSGFSLQMSQVVATGIDHGLVGEQFAAIER
jgi:hypothetical protein